MLLAMVPPAAPLYFLFRVILVLLLLVLSLTSPAAALGYRNVSLGTSLTTQGTTSWLSPSGDFAFGFLPATTAVTDNFLLAVWFAKIAEKTPVWFLRNNGVAPSLRAGSRVDFTNDGLLVLTDHTGTKQWTAPGGTASYAAMLDTGNFVLVSASANGAYRWQSFANPTDTIVPTQQLPSGTSLVARLMDADYSNGRFMVAVKPEGTLVLSLISVPNGNEYSSYWSSDIKDNGATLVFNTSGNVYMASSNGSVVSSVISGYVSSSDFYQRVTLEPDGLFRHYLYPKNATGGGGKWGAGGWSSSKQIPDDICTKLTTDFGSGACGYNALCTTKNQRPDCICLERYSFLDPDRKYLGCMPDFLPQNCSRAATDVTGYMMVQIDNSDWPRQDYEYFTGIDEKACEDGCLKDCFCAAAIYGGSRECWRKKLPLTNGRDNTLNRKVLLKISNNISNGGTSTQPTLPTTNEEKRKRGIPVVLGSLLIGSLSVIILILAAGLLSLLFWSPRRRIAGYQQQRLRQQSEISMLDSSMRFFTYNELEKATGGFKEELGRGAFGIVYKGSLSTDVQIAVKKLDKMELKDEQAEKEFVTEVKAIGLTHHKNLVRLLGYCNEGSNRLLVYEFLCNGSLMSLLFGSSGGVGLGWVQRAAIACGIARGLFYLHEECAKQIIHCDIKPQNVLLDKHLNPKISDFGMAKLLGSDQTRTATGIRGTKGYVAPEWFRPGPVTAKVDIYSFGVMLLEIVCCKRAIEPVHPEDRGDSEAEILTYWVSDCYKEGRIDLLVGDDLEARADMKRVQRFVMIALWCIQDDPALRPSMKKVTQMLEGAIEVSVPPDPSSFFSSVA